jgi:site-specific recombinase XerD
VDLVFTRFELLDLDLPEHVLGKRFDDAWRSTFRATARRALVTAGVDDRVPFILANDGTIDTYLTGVLRTFSGQTSGRTTMSSYGRHAVRLIRFLSEQGLDFESVKSTDLARYKRVRMGSGIEPISWNSEASALKSLFDAVILEGYRTDNPCSSPALAGYNRGAQSSREDPDLITLKQFERFRDVGLAFGRYGLRNVAFANFLLTTAARLTEGNEYRIAQLPTRQAVRDTPSRSISYDVSPNAAKGYKGRQVRISKTAVDSMRLYSDLLREDQVARAIESGKYVEDPGHFWLNQEGLPIGTIGWGDVFRRAEARSGVKATPKTLRHTSAVYLLSSLIRRTLSASEASREVEKIKGASTPEIYKASSETP